MADEEDGNNDEAAAAEGAAEAEAAGTGAAEQIAPPPAADAAAANDQNAASTDDLEGVLALSSTIRGMSGLNQITLGDRQPVTLTADGKAFNFGSKELGPAGAIMMASFLPRCRSVQQNIQAEPLPLSYSSHVPQCAVVARPLRQCSGRRGH